MGRSKTNQTFQQLSDKTGISEERLRIYENGEQPVPVAELEILAGALDMRIEEFFDQSGPIGKWRMDQLALGKFLELPADVQEFVCKPINRPYLTLAMRLSDLSVEKLRGIAEGLLEITY
jgi:transcriptional regulator with XRE-family HTH domain